MNGLEDRLTNDLTELADTAEFRPEGAAAIANSARRRRQHHRLRQVVLVAAVGAVLGGIAARELTDDEQVGTRNDPSPTTVTVAPTTTTPPQTTEPHTETTTSTTAAPPVEDQLALTGDGLGSVHFGDHYDTVVSALTAELGPPRPGSAAVSMDYDCGVPGGACEPEWLTECTSQGPNTVERWVRWAGLTLSFRGADAETLELKHWSTDVTGPLTTPEGVRLSDLPEVWKETYGDRITFRFLQGEEGVNGIDGVELDLRGKITGFAQFGANESMSSLSAGFSCWPDDF